MRGKNMDTGELSNSLASPIPRKPRSPFPWEHLPHQGRGCWHLLQGCDARHTKSSVEQDCYTEGLKCYRDISPWHKALWKVNQKYACPCAQSGEFCCIEGDPLGAPSATSSVSRPGSSCKSQTVHGAKLPHPAYRNTKAIWKKLPQGFFLTLSDTGPFSFYQIVIVKHTAKIF